MNKELPLISYIVTTQFIENKAGLKTLHKKVFTDFDIPNARKKAFEYFDAAVEILHSENEILTTENGKIIYRNPENYDQGLSIHLRINEDYKKFGIIDLKDTHYLIDAHYNLSTTDQRKQQIGRKAEKNYYDLLKINFLRNERYDIKFQFNSAIGRMMIENLKTKSVEEIEFVEYSLEHSIDTILETVCAFLNTGNGNIIFGQDEQFSIIEGNEKLFDVIETLQQHLQLNFEQHLDSIQLSKQICSGRKFIKIDISKSATAVLYKKEFYFRNRFGNVMDFDRSYL